MGEILEAIQGVYDFMTTESYNFIHEMFASMMVWVVTWWFKLKIAAIGFAWGVAQAMIDQLNISDVINQAWGSLDSNLLGVATRYNFPEAINILLNAFVTRFILNMV